MANIMSTIRTSAMSAPNTTFNILPRGKHTHTIILLHGRNSTGPDFADEVFEGIDVNAAAFAGCKWVFPTAPATWSEQFQEDLTEWQGLCHVCSRPAHAQGAAGRVSGDLRMAAVLSGAQESLVDQQ